MTKEQKLFAIAIVGAGLSGYGIARILKGKVITININLIPVSDSQ